MRHWIAGVLFALITFSGCAGNPKVLPKHDDVLLYPLAYDLVYLRTIEALESVPKWEVDEMEKERGIIRVRNTDYQTPGDADQRVITFVLSRIGKRETSVQIDPDSQHVVGGDSLLTNITKFMKREMKSA